MLPSRHIILGFLFTISLFLILPQIGLTGAIIIFLSTVLIDVDHYLYYLVAKKDLSLKNAYYWHLNNMRKYRECSKSERKKLRFAFCIFHGIEILIILFFLGFFSKFSVFYFILIGFSFHLFLDILNLLLKQTNPLSLFSQIYNLIRSKDKIAIDEYK